MSGTTSGTAARDGGGAAGGPPAAPGRRTPGAVLQGTAIGLGLVLMLGGFALIALAYRPYRVPTDSMDPTVRPGDTVLAHRAGAGRAGRGDIVVFRDRDWGSSLLVKRVVGVGGDTVACCDKRGRLTVDGRPVDEFYRADGYPGAPFRARVPRGRLFLMGDNRGVSLDSRVHLDDAAGTVPAADVLGRVEATVWPLRSARFQPRTTAFDALGRSGASDPGPLRPAAWATAAGAALILLTAGADSLAGALGRRRGRQARD